MSDVLTQLRDACARISQRARYVRINEKEVPAYAATLRLDPPAPAPADLPPPAPADLPPPADGPHVASGTRGHLASGRSEHLASGTREQLASGTREQLAAFWLTLDAINFGSGWFPTLRKQDGQSGYHTIATGIRDRFATQGPWSAEELQSITAAEIAQTLAQDPAHELMELFARSLSEVGRRVGDEYAGSFANVVDAAERSAERLVEQLAAWSSFEDVSNYGGLTVPFLKRAQIAAADLARAGVAAFADLRRLTMFADNLVPHVLRLDGVLVFDPGLVERIEREQLIAHGSPEEVEIRACAVHAVELIVLAGHGEANAADVDQLLWLRGQQPRYKASPRHRSRSTAY